jgi:uncharacterized protein (DUF1015 family)
VSINLLSNNKKKRWQTVGKSLTEISPTMGKQIDLSSLNKYFHNIWSPHTAANINKIEQVPRRDARFVNHDFHRQSSVTEMGLSARKTSKISTSHAV